MKKRKLIVLVVMLVVSSFVLTGCFFGSSESDSDFAENDHYQLDLKVRGEGRVKDLSEGKHEFEEGVVVDLEAIPDDGWKFKEWIGSVSETREKETSIVMDQNRKVTVIFEKIKEDDKDNGDSEDPEDVSFSYSRSGTRIYEFKPTDPDGAEYWEWKFPETYYGWDGYTSPQKVTHQFEEYGDSLVMLRILDEDREEIGVYSKEVRVE